MDAIELEKAKALALAEAQALAGPSPAMQQGLQELSAITQNPAKAQYDALPGWQKPIVAASDIVQLAGRAPLMGWGEKAVAAVRAPFTDKTYEQELEDQRRLTEGARRRSSGAGVTAEISGAVAGPMALTSKGVTLAGRAGTGAMEGVKGLAARTGLMAAEGAGYGAVNAAGEDQDIATGAGLGALFGAGGNVLGEAISAGAGKVAGLFSKRPNIPSMDDLRASGKEAFEQADKSGVIFNQTGVQRLGQGIIDDLTQHGFDPVNEPGIMPVVKRLQAMGETGNVTLKGLHSLRRVASNGFIPGNDSNNKLVSQVIARIDDLVEAADPNTLLVGNNPQQAATAFKKGLDTWRRVRKSEEVGNAVLKAERRAASTGSGGNADNAIRQNIRGILDKGARGYTAEEKAALETVVRGTPGQNILRRVGKAAPTGIVSGGLGSTVGATVGSLLGGPAGGAVGAVAVPAIGASAKRVADSMTARLADQADDIIRAGSRAATQAAPNSVQLLARQKRDALARALMALGVYETAGR